MDAGSGTLTVVSFSDVTASSTELTMGWNGTVYSSSTGTEFDVSIGDNLVDHSGSADC